MVALQKFYLTLLHFQQTYFQIWFNNVNSPFYGEVLSHLSYRKIGQNCRCVNCLDFKQNGMPMALILFCAIIRKIFQDYWAKSDKNYIIFSASSATFFYLILII